MQIVCKQKKRPEWKPPNAFIFNVENSGIEPLTF